jgi:hypothetical protein
MATRTRSTIPRFEAAFEQATRLGDQTFEVFRKAGHLYVDSYEKVIDGAVAAQLKVAGLTEQEWLKSLIEAQADTTRELANSYATAARAILK